MINSTVDVGLYIYTYHETVRAARPATAVCPSRSVAIIRQINMCYLPLHATAHCSLFTIHLYDNILQSDPPASRLPPAALRRLYSQTQYVAVTCLTGYNTSLNITYTLYNMAENAHKGPQCTRVGAAQ